MALSVLAHLKEVQKLYRENTVFIIVSICKKDKLTVKLPIIVFFPHKVTFYITFFP